MARWRIDIIGDKRQPVGIIEAKTAEQAIDEAAKIFRMGPTARDKLMATEVETQCKCERPG
jgi:hypothetical protein